MQIAGVTERLEGSAQAAMIVPPPVPPLTLPRVGIDGVIANSATVTASNVPTNPSGGLRRAPLLLLDSRLEERSIFLQLRCSYLRISVSS